MACWSSALQQHDAPPQYEYFHPLQVHTRKGSTVSIKDLKSVSVDKAATVLVMQPNSNARDSLSAAVLSQAQVASAAMAVASLTETQGTLTGQRLVLQNPSGHEVWGVQSVEC